MLGLGFKEVYKDRRIASAKAYKNRSTQIMTIINIVFNEKIINTLYYVTEKSLSIWNSDNVNPP